MKRFFQWLLQFLDLQRGAAIFVFTLLASGLVCSWMGLRSAHVYEAIDLTNCVKNRVSEGGPSEPSVERQIAYVREKLRESEAPV